MTKEAMPGISPLAILAAVLFNYNKSEMVKIKMDDSEEEKEVLAESIGVESEGDAVVCCIPMHKVLKYMQVNHNFKFRVVEGELQVVCEKAYNKSTLYSASGQTIETDSPVVEELFSRLK